MAEKELFIHAVQMVEVDGSWNIPTAVLYEKDGSVLVGNAALAASADYKLVNEDFKIDLGRYAPAQQVKRQFATATGQRKTAIQIADDFLFQIQKLAHTWLVGHGIGACKNIVVAEPLSMHTEEVSPEWLANYRAAIRRILEGKTILSPSGTNIRFVPEPFAAFQYYRHGIRHPLVSQTAQINALVIDFGGGTCDVCIIQTTKEGDISGSGQNKRPLAGKSLPVGGFTLNRAIAEYLIKKVCGGRLDSDIKAGLRDYREWHAGNRPLDTLDPRFRAFIENFHALVHRVENLKLALSRATTDWSLEAAQGFSASVAVPVDPLMLEGKNTYATMSVADLRDIFTNQVYTPQLKSFFAARLKAGREVLEHAALSVALLSGGSANLGWLKELLRRDFGEYLHHVPFVQIPDYQQVVAHGLAVDCAREFATGSSDFKGVTYNPLFLLLDPDESGCDPRPFVRRSESLPEVRNRPGLLLPTASMLSSFVDRPMHWKIRLNRSPSRKLDYFFLQSSMDLGDVKNRQNVEETTIHTPPRVNFDASLGVQLTIRSDGTAVPRFIYKAGGLGGAEIAKEGRKFFVDMTDASGGGGEAYLGLDFGTSNTAISYVDRSWVQLIEKRSQDPSWREIGELVDDLAVPLAIPLARYIGDNSQSSVVPPGFSFIEAGLCLAAYISYIEFCSLKRRATTRLFRNFPHRSASYLWHLLKDVQYQLGKQAVVSAPFQQLCEQANAELLERLTRKWAEARHELTIADKDELLNAVRLLGNAAYQVFSKNSFGYFEGVQKERLSNRYSGRFRIAHGKPPHTEFLEYSGSHSFSGAEALLLNVSKGEGLVLSPLVLWYPCSNHPDMDKDNGHCFLFDKLKGEGAETRAKYKATGFTCQLEFTSADTAAGDLLTQLTQFTTNDPELFPVQGLKLNESHPSAIQI